MVAGPERCVAVDDLHSSSRRAYRRAVQQRAAGNVAAAEEAFREAAAGGDPDAAFHLGLILDERNETADAVRAWRQAAAGGNLKAALNLGLVLAYELRRPDEARRLFRSVATDRNDPRGRFELAFLLWYEGDYSGADEALRDAASAGNARAHIHRGFLLADQDLEEDAAEAFMAAASLDVDGAWTQAGWQLARLDRLAEAEQVLRRGIQNGEAVAWPILGEVLDALGRQEGQTCFDEATRAARGVSLSYRDLLGRLDGEDLRHDELARWAADECDARTPFALAALLFDAPRLAETETRLQLQMNSGDPEARATLDELHALTGRRRE